MDVRRAVRAGQGGVAHRPGDDDRLLAGVPQVQQVGGLLDGVRALGDHHPVAAGPEGVGDGVREGAQVVEAEGRPRQAPEVADAQLDVELLQGRYGGEELVGGQRGHDSAGGRIGGHGDGAAQGEDRNCPRTQRRCLLVRVPPPQRRDDGRVATGQSTGPAGLRIRLPDFPISRFGPDAGTSWT